VAGWDAVRLSRRDLLKAGAAGSLGLSAVALLAACQDENKKATGATGATTAPVRGGTITVAMISSGQAETVSVPTAVNLVDTARVVNLYDGLFGYDDQGNVVPALAESAEPNADATLWTVTLRDGVVFHDGKPLTADDVVYTIKSWGSPDSYFSPIAGLIIDFKGVRKRGDLVVEVPMLLGVAEFPSVTTFFNAFVIQDGFDDFANPIGTGPFKFESFTPGRSSEFVANPDYWEQGKPYIERLIIDSSYTTDDARMNALLAGDADVVPSLPYASAKANENSSDIQVVRSAGNQFNALKFRIDEVPFSDPLVMQALKLVVDRPQLADVVYSGFGVPGNDVAPAGVEYFPSDIPAPTRDPEQARSLLSQAGQEGLTFTLETAPAFSGQVEAATLFKEQAREAGIEVNLKQVDPGLYFTFDGGLISRPAGQTFWLTLPSMTVWYLEALWSGAPYNETGWGNDQTDSVLFDAMGEVDPSAAQEKWRAVSEQQIDSGGYVMYVNPDYIDGYLPNVRDLKPSPKGWVNYWKFKDGWLDG
jgi:peptide/nickel transport system substrate-binding protein